MHIGIGITMLQNVRVTGPPQPPQTLTMNGIALTSSGQNLTLGA